VCQLMNRFADGMQTLTQPSTSHNFASSVGDAAARLSQAGWNVVHGVVVTPEWVFFFSDPKLELFGFHPPRMITAEGRGSFAWRTFSVQKCCGVEHCYAAPASLRCVFDPPKAR
jgi:hypothetical protein